VGRGASPAGRGASPQDRGPSPSRSWASLRLFSSCHRILAPFLLSSSSGRKLGAYKRFREEGDKHCEEQRAKQSKVRTLREREKSCEYVITLLCEEYFVKNHLPRNSVTDTKNLFPFSSAMELSSEESCPTQRGWSFCPARAPPFLIKRGACPLHDLEEVGKRGKELS
jgi:hypothetical protein